MFKYTQKQLFAYNLINSLPVNRPHYLLLYGGSQSAKTSFSCRYIQDACLKYPKTTALICRNYFTDLKATIFQNTFKKMMSLRFGDDIANNSRVVEYIYSSPMMAKFRNGSQVYFLGLNDTYGGNDKVLGRYSSIFLIDEASEVGYDVFAKLQTRLNENTGARKLGLITMNPTTIFSWTYKMFIEKINPIDNKPLKNSHFFKSLQMNPQDNLENLPEGYLENLENLSEHDRERFLFGNFMTTAQGAVYEDQINRVKEEKRICDVGKIDFNYPLFISLDIGWDDFNSAWVFQILPDKIIFYFYQEENKIDLPQFLNKIEEKIFIAKGRKWQDDTIILLPHDASHTWVGSGMTIKQVLTLYASHTPTRPKTFKILAIRGIYEGINACRIIFPKCFFDLQGCDIGLRRLAQYKEVYLDGNDAFKKQTKHDMASHAADSFRYAISSFYFQKPFQENFRRDPTKIYGYDIVNEQTKQKMAGFF